MGWLIALTVVVGVLCLPIGICAQYNADGAAVWLLAGPARVCLYPKQKEQKTEDPKKTKKKPAGTVGTGKSTPNQKKGGSFQDFLPLISVVLDFLNDFRLRLRVKRLELKLILAAEDPSDLAVNYGRAWAALGNLMPQLERFFVIKKRNLEVECDFTANDAVVDFRLELTITIGRVLHIAGLHGIRAIYHYFTIMNQRKGGANT